MARGKMSEPIAPVEVFRLSAFPSAWSTSASEPPRTLSAIGPDPYVLLALGARIDDV